MATLKRLILNIILDYRLKHPAPSLVEARARAVAPLERPGRSRRLYRCGAAEKRLLGLMHSVKGLVRVQDRSCCSRVAGMLQGVLLRWQAHGDPTYVEIAVFDEIAQIATGSLFLYPQGDRAATPEFNPSI